MAMISYDDKSGSLYVFLVDGILPDTSKLIQVAEQVSKDIEVFPETKQRCFIKKPYRWDQWSEDGLFQYIAYNMRILFDKNIRTNCGHSRLSEAWLLKPTQWEKEYELKECNEKSRRRLYVTMHDEYRQGKGCLMNTIDKTGIGIIPGENYRNVRAFRKTAKQFIEDIALPFQNPGMIAEERIQKRGYDLLTFGR
ncbi:MAG: hypothetical protein ABFD91_06535 [Anaerohalosphaeraceae bacterium]